MEITIYKNSNGILYRVNNFETLETICKKLNVNREYVLKHNNISNVELKKGQILFIPNKNIICYVVSPMDTIFSIAKKYDVSEQDIIKENKVDILFVGQKLFINKNI